MFSQTGTESLRKASGSIAEVRGRKECREMDMKQIQPAVKNETKHVALYTAIGTVVMWVLFAVLHAVIPEKVPFDYTVFLGGIAGSAVAVLNFFLMGMTVQKVAAIPEDQKDMAFMKMKASYSQRLILQILWIILAITLPCFHFVAGIAPLLFPGFGIKIGGLLGKKQKTA